MQKTVLDDVRKALEYLANYTSLDVKGFETQLAKDYKSTIETLALKEEVEKLNKAIVAYKNLPTERSHLVQSRINAIEKWKEPLNKNLKLNLSPKQDKYLLRDRNKIVQELADRFSRFYQHYVLRTDVVRQKNEFKMALFELFKNNALLESSFIDLTNGLLEDNDSPAILKQIGELLHKSDIFNDADFIKFNNSISAWNL